MSPWKRAKSGESLAIVSKTTYPPFMAVPSVCMISKSGLRPYPCPARSAHHTKLTAVASSGPGAVLNEASTPVIVAESPAHSTWYLYMVLLARFSTTNVCVKSVSSPTVAKSTVDPSSLRFIVEGNSELHRAMMLMEESETSPDWAKTSDVVTGSSTSDVVTGSSIEAGTSVFSNLTVPSMPTNLIFNTPSSVTDACPNDCSSWNSGERFAQRS
mmetsp:Transcript_1009/g.2347  ORF Transcript_1009/g.2347 Transcript_1009/m.2347 type:complete len:214 (+) Transcript_1009:797-1438(+)